MHARPVVGGLFIKLLADREIWNKWASRDKLAPKNWAALPMYNLRVLLPTEQPGSTQPTRPRASG